MPKKKATFIPLSPERQKLVADHYDYAIKVTRKMIGKKISPDFIGAALLGLTLAGSRFDFERNYQFTTYSTYWIKACVMEELIKRSKPASFGTRRQDRNVFFKFGYLRELYQRSPEEAAARARIRLEELHQVINFLSANHASDGDLAYDHARDVKDNPETQIIEIDSAQKQKEALHNGLWQLDPRERAIIKARHLRQRPATLKVLGEKFGISRERVRQLETRAKDKLTRFVEGQGKW